MSKSKEVDRRSFLKLAAARAGFVAAYAVAPVASAAERLSGTSNTESWAGNTEQNIFSEVKTVEIISRPITTTVLGTNSLGSQVMGLEAEPIQNSWSTGLDLHAPYVGKNGEIGFVANYTRLLFLLYKIQRPRLLISFKKFHLETIHPQTSSALMALFT